MSNSVDPDQLASSEANWSGSTLFTKADFIRDQQDQVILTATCYLFICCITLLIYWK